MPVRFREGKNTTYLYKLIHYIGAFRHTDIKLMDGANCTSAKELQKRQSRIQQAERRLREQGILEKKIISGQWFCKKKNIYSGPEPYDGAFRDYVDAMKRFVPDGHAEDIDPAYLRRGRRLSQSAIIADAVGCTIFPDEKPELGSGQYTEGVFYYAPREIVKHMDEKEYLGVRGSRITGYVLSDRDSYAFYVVSPKDKALGDITEMRAAYASARIIDRTRKNTTGDNAIGKAVCLMSGPDCVKYMMEKNRVFTDVYKAVYAVEMNLFGEHLAEIILSDPEYLKTLLASEGVDSSSVDCDFITDDGTYVLSFFMPDISRLMRFEKAAQVYEDSRFKIACFTEQVEELRFLKKIKNISIAAFDFDDYYSDWKEGK